MHYNVPMENSKYEHFGTRDFVGNLVTDVRVLEKYGFHDSNEEMSLAIRKKRIEYEDWNSFLQRMFGEKKKIHFLRPFECGFQRKRFLRTENGNKYGLLKETTFEP